MFCFTVSACVLSVAVYYSFIIAAPLLSPIYGEPWDVAISGRSRSPLCFIYAHFCCNLLQKQQQCHGQLVPHVTATISLSLRVVLECKFAPATTAHSVCLCFSTTYCFCLQSYRIVTDWCGHSPTHVLIGNFRHRHTVSAVSMTIQLVRPVGGENGNADCIFSIGNHCCSFCPVILPRRPKKVWGRCATTFGFS